MVHVHLHGRLFDEQQPRDLAVRQALNDELVDLALTRRERATRIDGRGDRLSDRRRLGHRLRFDEEAAKRALFCDAFKQDTENLGSRTVCRDQHIKRSPPECDLFESRTRSAASCVMFLQRANSVDGSDEHIWLNCLRHAVNLDQKRPSSATRPEAASTSALELTIQRVLLERRAHRRQSRARAPPESDPVARAHVSGNQ